MIKRTLNILWLSFVGILLLAAVATTVLRLWIPTLADYRHDIEARVSDYLGKEVTIGRLEADWYGLNPAIRLEDVRINNPQDPDGQLDVEEIWIGIDAVHFLLERTLRASVIGVAGTELTIVRDTNGKLFIEGFANEDSDFSFDEFFRIRRLSITSTNIVWKDLRPGNKPISVTDASLTMVNHDDYVSVSGHVSLPADLGARVEFNARIFAVESSFSDWNGQVYLKGESLAIQGDLIEKVSKSLLLSGRADVRLWVDFSDAAIDSFTGEIQLNDLRISNSVTNSRHQVHAISGQLGWQRTETGWKFVANQLMEPGADVIQQPVNFSLESRRFNDSVYLSGLVPELMLDEIAPWLSLVPGLGEDNVAHLLKLQPTGRVSQLAFTTIKEGEETRLQSLDAVFDGIGFEAVDKLPAVKGLSGSLSQIDGKGSLHLASDQLEIRADKYLRQPVSFDNLNVDITFTNKDNHLNIHAESLSLQNSDLALSGQFSLDLSTGKSPVIDLHLDIERLALASVPVYLPAKVMSVRGVAWLDRSLVAGDVHSGSVLIQGPLDRLPFDAGEGKLEVRLPVSHAILDFNPEWTRIEKLDAQVNFTGRRMDVNSKQGLIRSARLKTVTAIIKDLAKPTLVLKGTITGPLPVMLAELGSSPLGERYGVFVDNVTTRGAAVLDLDLLVPLRSNDDSPIEVSGNVALAGNTLYVSDTVFGLEKMKGNIEFDDDGLSGRALTATLFDQNVTANTWTDEETGAVRISLDGKLDLIGELAGDNQLFGAIVKGDADWHVLISVGVLGSRNKIPKIGLNLRTHLEGTEVLLPAPFGKVAHEQRILVINSTDVTGSEKQFTFNYGDGVSGILALRTNENGLELERGNIALGGAEPGLPGQKKILVTGQLDELSVTQWLAALPGTGGGGLPLNLAVSTDRLEVLGFWMDDVTIKSGKEGKVYNFDLSGRGVAGDIHTTMLDNALDKIVVNLEHLRIRKKDKPEENDDEGVDVVPEETPDAAEGDPFMPADFPNLQVTIQRFEYGKANFGPLELQATRTNDAVHIERFVLDSKQLAMRASGDWYSDAAGQSVSDFELNVSDGKMDALMSAFGYQKNISGGQLSGRLKARWPGAPWDVTPSKMQGELKLTIKDGRLVDVDPGVGRLLGILGLHTIQRRLSLDFSDLLRKGFSFDRIGGNFVIKDGSAYTEDLEIKGPAARIEVTGRIGLADEDYDEVVTIIPRVGSSIPIAGAIAGGPVVGAVLILADKLLEGEIEDATRFSQRRYHVTGSWAEPVYERVKIPAKKNKIESEEETYLE